MWQYQSIKIYSFNDSKSIDCVIDISLMIEVLASLYEVTIYGNNFRNSVSLFSWQPLNHENVLWRRTKTSECSWNLILKCPNNVHSSAGMIHASPNLINFIYIIEVNMHRDVLLIISVFYIRRTNLLIEITLFFSLPRELLKKVEKCRWLSYSCLE